MTKPICRWCKTEHDTVESLFDKNTGMDLTEGQLVSLGYCPKCKVKTWSEVYLKSDTTIPQATDQSP